MDLADRIDAEVRRLPESLGQEVLDFIGTLEIKHGFNDSGIEELKKAQTPAMAQVWDHPEEAVWDERKI